MEIFDIALDGLSEAVRAGQEQREKEYDDEKGLIHCGVCGEARQMWISVGDTSRLVYRQCLCQREKAQKEQQLDKKRKLERRAAKLRETAFCDSRLAACTFENDDRKNPHVSDALLRYAARFGEMLDEGKGLLLYGPVGTGKSFLAACVANHVIDVGYSVRMLNLARMLNELQSRMDGRQDYIDGLCRADLLVLDDLGMERDSGFAREQVYNLIDARSLSGKPMIITTNLAYTELVACEDAARRRIYDRVLEACYPIEVKGESRRRRTAAQNMAGMKELLGL